MEDATTVRDGILTMLNLTWSYPRNSIHSFFVTTFDIGLFNRIGIAAQQRADVKLVRFELELHDRHEVVVLDTVFKNAWPP